METTMFKVETPIFEGPLELLLHLIQKRKLYISDISLAQVADEYISYIQKNSQQNIQDRMSFITIASTLLLIKSKSLLPTLELSYEEEEDIKNLEVRLFVYDVIQGVAKSVVQPTYLAKPSFPRKISRTQKKEVVFSPDSSITQESLFLSIHTVIASVPTPQAKKPNVFIEKTESIETIIDNLASRIQKSLSMSFTHFSDASHKKTDHGKKVHVIVSFLALLELVRQGLVDAKQKETGDIDILHLSQ
jgi:segregation and condensation protein A